MVTAPVDFSFDGVLLLPPATKHPMNRKTKTSLFQSVTVFIPRRLLDRIDACVRQSTPKGKRPNRSRWVRAIAEDTVNPS